MATPRCSGLNRLAPNANLAVKLECFNPLSSAKDRAALYMLNAAEEAGLLREGTVIIEPTSGNTGVGLAYIAALRGYHLILTMPDTMSQERRSCWPRWGRSWSSPMAPRGCRAPWTGQ